MNTRDNFDTLAPEFRVNINGKQLPLEAQADLIGATVLEDVDAAGMFAITMQGWDGVEMKPKWIDEALFREGNPVEVEMGYKDRLKTVLKGEITGLEPDFLEGQSPTFTVRGHDRRHRLMRGRKTRTFTNAKDSDIARRIAGEASLKPEIEDTSVALPYVIQHNQTDLAFLLERAKRIGFEVVVDGTTLSFRRRRYTEKEIITLRREIELLEFQPRLSTVGQVEEVVVQGWDIKTKKEFVARSRSGGDSNMMGGSVSGPSTVQKAFAGARNVSVNAPVHSQEEADQFAKGLFAEMALGYIKAEGICIGEPDLKAGSVVKVEGIGQRFSGLYYVTSTEHKYRKDKGYRTAFVARRNAT